MSFPLAVVAAGISAFAFGAAPKPLSPAGFAKRPGWHVGAGRVHACPGVPRSLCTQVGSWAATVPWRDCHDCAIPHRTLASLSRGGIVIYLLLASERNPPRRPLQWPPRLRAGAVVSPIEGAPERIGMIGRSGRVHGFTVALWLYFARPHPTSTQLARAQRELRTARLP